MMASSINNIEKKGRGRPATDATPVLVRVQRPDMNALDQWIDRQPDPKPSRPEAIRIALRDWLTSLGLRKAIDEREDRQ